MRTLLEFLPQIERLNRREAVRWSNGLRTWRATYADLHGKIGTVIQRLEALGLRKGNRVLIWAENRMEWIAVFWACVARGIEVVPVDFRFSTELVGRIRKECMPHLVADNTFLQEIAAGPPSTTFSCVDVSPDDVVEIVYTSGTTGEPKGVVHRHRNLVSNLSPFQTEIEKYKRWAKPFQPIRILDLLPLSHMFGQSLGLFIPLLLEGSVAFTSELHPRKIIEFTHDNNISVMVCVPRILESLKSEVERSAQRKPGSAQPQGIAAQFSRQLTLHRQFGWKFWSFVVGGARVDPELEEFWKKHKFAIVQGYGLTEASLVIAVNHPFDTRTGSIGRALPGQEVMIAPDGEILVRGESVTGAEGGWLHTGDLGEIDSERRLYFRGRKKNLIVTPEGLNVYPEDVEKILNSFSEVRESAVVGTDHVHAVLILNDKSHDVEELIRRANARLESHQRIRNWSIWPHDALPRTASTLKLQRHEIVRQLGMKSTSTPSSALPELSALSSLERVELLSDLENKYQMEFDEESYSKLTTRDDLETWLRHPELAAVSDDRTAPESDWARSLPVRWFRAAFQHVIALPLFRHYIQLKVEGLEHLDGLKTPVIFIANHTSHLDVPTIFTALPHVWHQRLTPAMMKEHFRAYFEPKDHSFRERLIAGISYFLACSVYNAYPLPQRMSGTRRALLYTGQLTSRGYCPIVFPEGLRTSDGKLQKFRPGIGMMAVRLQIPIVPMRLSGLYEIYSLHDSWPRRGTVRVWIGKPITFDAHTPYEEVARQLEQIVKGTDNAEVNHVQ